MKANTLLLGILLMLVLLFVYQTQKPSVECNPPYIRAGVECCLDYNKNNVCDRDEAYTTTSSIVSTSTTSTVSEITQTTTQSKTCSDGKQNGGEEGIDCGGQCIECKTRFYLTTPSTLYFQISPGGTTIKELKLKPNRVDAELEGRLYLRGEIEEWITFDKTSYHIPEYGTEKIRIVVKPPAETKTRVYYGDLYLVSTPVGSGWKSDLSKTKRVRISVSVV